MASFSSSPSSFLTLSTTPPTSFNKFFKPPSHNKPLNCFSNSPPTNLKSSSSKKQKQKLDHILTEFRSLPQPIDRVKRLLHYATLLPSSNELDRVSSNRVTGCTVEVWLDVSMDELGRMRFLADSDSEIMKGFCSCLVWLLDGEFPEQVLNLEMEDLEVLNINGLYGRPNSRVNTWNNVLISMKKRTQLLVDLHKHGLSSVCFLQSSSSSSS